MRAINPNVDEGNELCRAIASRVEISVFVRDVYTQKSVLLALEEVFNCINTFAI